jgi:hypothetical protein
MKQSKELPITFWWAILIISTVGLGYAIYAHWEWLTLILPFVTTAFVKALRIM